MDAAQALILQQGFAATSIDQIIERTGVTKGAFFYHFKSKSDLAHALVERYAAVDAEHLERTLDRAEHLGRDPLQQVLIFVGLLREEAGELTEPFAGCLYASYCYEAQLFDEHTFAVVRSGVQHWRERFRGKLQAAIDHHRLRLPATAEELSGMILAIFEGSFILSRILAEPQYIAEQLGQYRNYLELLFAPVASPVGGARTTRATPSDVKNSPARSCEAGTARRPRAVPSQASAMTAGLGGAGCSRSRSRHLCQGRGRIASVSQRAIP
jgi:TetR/AcrR family transcriptional repressor of nem operon